MDYMYFVYVILLWIVMMVFAILNGLIRDKIYGRNLNSLQAHQISSIIFIVFVFLFTHIFYLIYGFVYLNQVIYAGVILLLLTIVFEFTFGHFILKHKWVELLDEYNIFKGHLWPLILIALFFAPILVNI